MRQAFNWAVVGPVSTRIKPVLPVLRVKQERKTKNDQEQA
jgi:hypothetical protein